MKFEFNEKENIILDATEELFIKQGYDKTSVSEIAKESGIGKGTVYLYFKSKDELVETMFVRELARHNMKWYDYTIKDPKGGLLHRMYINQLKAMRTSRFMEAIYKR